MSKVLDFKKKISFKEHQKDLEMSNFFEDLKYLISIHTSRKVSAITIIGGLVIALGKTLAKHDPTASNANLRGAIFQHILNHQGKEILNDLACKDGE